MKRGIIGYSLLAVLIIIFIGVVIYNSAKEKKEVLLSPTCYDTDNGVNVFVKGTVVLETYIWDDECVSSSSVLEHYCYSDGRTVISAQQNCLYGTRCLAGACVNSPYNMYLKFDETSGGIASDSSGYGNKGVIYSAYRFPGKYGNALQFMEDTGSYVSVYDSSSLKSNRFTASAWIYLNSYPIDWRRVIGKSNFNFAADDGWDIAVINEGGVTKLNARLGGADYLQIMYPKLPVNEWHLITLTYDGSQAKLYIDNGAGTYRNFDCAGCNSKYAVKSIVKTIPQNTLPLMIGKDNGYWKKTINAKIDEVKYYNRALTHSEIENLYNSNNLGNCVDTDSGVIYDEVGTCTDYPNGVKTDHPDVCDTQGKQWETYCNLDGKTCGYTYHFCPAGTTCTNGVCTIPPTPSLPSCIELYNGINVKTDSNRFNIVFVGMGFKSVDDLKVAAKRIVDIDGNSSSKTISDGLMQIPVFKNNQNKFNFWYVDYTRPFSSKDPQTISNELYNFYLIKSCQDILPNRVIPVFIYPGQIGSNDYPYASYGRNYVTLTDCLDSESNCNGGDYPNLQNGNIHELLHTIPCLGDEYGSWGNNPQPSSMQAVDFNNVLTGNANLQFYVGSYNNCIINAPWKNMIGNGCGIDGIIDCFSNDCSQPLSYVNGVDTRPECCISGKDCGMEIGCFEGGLYSDKGIWRSSGGGVMRNIYGKLNGEAYLNKWDQQIVSKVLAKGPAIGKVWKEGQNYDLDCDATTSDFG